jgi:hypothetical protein
MNPLINERHISFAKHKENDPNENNHTAIIMNDDDGGGGNENISTGFYEKENEEKKKDLFFICLAPLPINTTMKSKLIRRNSFKLRKPSVRMKDSGKGKNHLIRYFPM